MPDEPLSDHPVPDHPAREHGKHSAQAPAARKSGRNLPVAIGVGLGLIAVLAASLAFRPEPFVVLAAIAVGAAGWELKEAFARRDLHITFVPYAVGTLGILVTAFLSGGEGLIVAFMVTVAACAAWRVIEGTGTAAVRDVAASTFAVAYLPFMAGFVMLTLAEPDGRIKVLLLILLAVANDVGGFTAGVLFGRHPLAPSVSPKKSWEGLAGSFVLAIAIGVVGVRFALGGPIWVGVLLGVIAPLTATVGDLAESMIKRDLGLKDMGSLLPGHGGVLDRIDSIVLTAPFIYIILTACL